MLWLKECARRGGDLYLDEGLDGPETVCIQCGFRAYGGSRVNALAAISDACSKEAPRRRLRRGVAA